MKKIVYVFSIIVWLAFLYTALTTILYFIDFVFDFSTENTAMKALVLTSYIVTLELLAIIYKKIKHKPQNKYFKWLNSVSLFS